MNVLNVKKEAAIMKPNKMLCLMLLFLSFHAPAKTWDEIHSDNQTARHERHQSEKKQISARHDREEQRRHNRQDLQHQRQDARNQRQIDRHHRIDERMN